MDRNHNVPSREFNPSYVVGRPDVLSLIPPDTQNLLDVGCSNGTFGLFVKKKLRSVKVTGIEIDPAMASIAKQKLDDIYIVDLNRVYLLDLFPKKSFDCIVMADIIEHLIDPWSVIKQAKSLLSNKGSIITSIPNVRHISTIISIIWNGKWPYRKRGIHDVTHLRFFTRSNILEMFAKTGLKMVKEKKNMRIVESGSRIDRWARLFNIPGLDEFFTFQYLHVCIPSKDNDTALPIK